MPRPTDACLASTTPSSALLAGLLPRRQVLLKRPDVTRVLNLTVDPETHALCATAPLGTVTEEDQSVGPVRPEGVVPLSNLVD